MELLRAGLIIFLVLTTTACSSQQDIDRSGQDYKPPLAGYMEMNTTKAVKHEMKEEKEEEYKKEVPVPKSPSEPSAQPSLMTNETTKIVAEKEKAGSIEETMSLMIMNTTSDSTVRVRGVKDNHEEKAVKEEREENVDERSPVFKSPYNTKPGVRSEFYDKSKIYWFGSGLNASTPFDVTAIYNRYLSRLSVKCAYPPPKKLVIGQKELAEAIKYASDRVDYEISQAVANSKAGNVVPNNVISAEGRHFITGKLPEELNDFVDQEEAQFLEYVTQYLQSRFCIQPVDILDKVTKIPIDRIRSKHLKCSRKHSNYGGAGLKCRNTRYRSYDGFCNNLEHTFWGKANVCHVRFLPPAYQDGIFLPRAQSITGKPLPDPRTVSLALHSPGEGKSFYTAWHFTWGQYVIHDAISTPQSVPDTGSGVKCCPGSKDYSKCMPILLQPNDYQAKERKCINFVRSAPCPLCSLGPRQQLNFASSYIDQSAMYGTDNATAASLRTFRGGLMKVGLDRYKKPILPNSASPLTDQCSKPALGPDKVCFHSGDARVNQQPFIQLIHSLFLRRHNQHATNLARVNPRAPDEILFQEARRLTIAELQHITYYEYLPVLLGPEMLDYFNILDKDSLQSEYESDIDATSWNECAAAACRFGHSQVTSIMPLAHTASKMALKDSFFDPKFIHSGLIPNLITSLSQSPSAVTDPHLTEPLKNHLYFHSGIDVFGSDLAAFNIQRGRDHGIPPYVDYIKFCFGFTIRGWQDLVAFIPPEGVGKLRGIYDDWRDIDLFTGGLYEKKAIDADLGPTFACIVGIQFYHFKFGDRYWYSHKDQAGSFTKAQLAEIKNKVTLASFLCQVEPQLLYTQQYAFLLPSLYNPRLNCADLRARNALNYNLWKGYF